MQMKPLIINKMNMKIFLIQTISVFTCLLILTNCTEKSNFQPDRRLYSSHESLDLFIDEEVKISAHTIPPKQLSTWESENPSVATVSSSGVVRGISVGNTKIVVRCGELMREISVNVVVRIPITGIEVSIPPDLMVGGTSSLSVTFLPVENNENKLNNNLIWQSSDPTVVTVTGGRVTAVSLGNAIITVFLERDPFIRTEVPVRVVSWVDITNSVLQNTETPFACGPPVIHEGRWCEAIGWTANEVAKENGNVETQTTGGRLCLWAAEGWTPFANMENGKLYQTVELDAGTYRFEAEINFSYTNAATFEAYLVAALGNEMLDVADVEQTSLAFVEIPSGVNGGELFSFDFELSDKNNVSLGFVVNLFDYSELYINQVKLFQRK